MNKKEFSDEQVNDIKNYYLNDHLSSRKICALYDCSKSVIERVLRENGVMMRDDSHKCRKYTLNENYFDEIDTPNKAYIVGMLWSDGYNCVTKDEVKLTLQARDRDILDKINLELESNRPLKFKDNSTKNPNHQDTYRLSIYNKHMSRQLERLGMVQGKSLVLTYPEWLDKKLVPHFIRGLMDGDGHISKDSNCVELIGTVMLLDRLKELIDNNINAYCYIKNASKNNEEVTRVLRITGEESCTNFLNWIYKDATIYLNRKFDVYKNRYC